MRYYKLNSNIGLKNSDRVKVVGILITDFEDDEFYGVYLHVGDHLLRLHANNREWFVEDSAYQWKDVSHLTSDDVYEMIPVMNKVYRDQERIDVSQMIRIRITTDYSIPDSVHFFKVGQRLVLIEGDSLVGGETCSLDKEQSAGIITWINQWLSFDITQREGEDLYKLTKEFDKFILGKGFSKTKSIHCVGIEDRTLRVDDTDELDDFALTQVFDDLLSSLQDEEF